MQAIILALSCARKIIVFPRAAKRQTNLLPPMLHWGVQQYRLCLYGIDVCTAFVERDCVHMLKMLFQFRG